MKIKRGPVVFNNVLSSSVRVHVNNWGVAAKEFRNAIIQNGLYAIGPVVYQVRDFDEQTEEADFTFYIPVNRPLILDDNEQFTFTELWEFKDTLLLRHADLDDDLDETYSILQECAETYQFTITDSFYHIYLDVYGEGIIDVFAPIKEEVEQ